METAQTPRTAAQPERHGPGHALLARWPTVLGLGVLAWSVVSGLDAHVTAMIIILAAMCYLAAAALGSRRSGWVVAGAATVAVAIAMVTALDAVVLLLVAAAAFAGYGLLRGGRVDRRELGIQTAGFVVFAAIALTAMSVGPVAAAYLAAATAIGHAVWDLVHLRRDAVVPRSLAEFCVVLDTGLGVGLLAVVWAAGT